MHVHASVEARVSLSLGASAVRTVARSEERLQRAMESAFSTAATSSSAPPRAAQELVRERMLCANSSMRWLPGGPVRPIAACGLLGARGRELKGPVGRQPAGRRKQKASASVESRRQLIS